ncbi:LTA synthase family protein [Prevotella histicola]|uniref:LTA synthase family protein n=1 Tax=Prevotella histicola TaxID=470565 RepID=UPI001C605DE1|nr:alkaline phosphatase family protein [Prevotella histicola]MBW4756344.1 sulfatase-like hydrolase/transferase [Prevotella histicola]
MYQNLKYLIKHSAVILVILFFVRICFAIAFVPINLISSNLGVLPRLLFNVLRFDIQVVCYVLLLPTVLTLVFAALHKPWTERLLSRFRKVYFSIVCVLLLAISGIDMGFFANFNSHINLTFFDFFNEEPVSLIQTVWEEYHCVYEAIAFLLVTIPVLLLIRRIESGNSSSRQSVRSSTVPTPSRRRIVSLSAILLSYVAFLVIGMRGSVRRFPLQIEDTFVSNQKILNDLVPNAVYMFKKAYKEKKNAFRMEGTADLLRQYKFKSLQEALDVYTEGKVKMQNNDTLAALQRALFAEVGDSLKQPQPNIVIIYSESWSNYLFNLQQKNAEMYFGLERHFKEGLLFRNFQSVQNGTVASLENLYVSTPFPRFFASAYRFKTLPTSIALPFKASNYTTIFMSGMDAAWENCTEALGHQQFDAIYDKFFILKDYPRATYNSIGVYDEYLFQALLDKLNKPSEKRQMITVMTTTNHPPFEFPKDLTLPPLPDSFYGKKCFAEHNRKVLDKYLTGFRYYNKALNDFLNRFKASAAAKNTILVITGDHNVRVILNHDAIDKRYEHSVPLYVYLPPYLRKEAYNKLTNRWGSHDDILATLAPFAFRNTKYFKMGKNLLDTSVSDSTYYSANVEQIESIPTYRKKAERLTAARNLLRLVYFTKVLH